MSRRANITGTANITLGGKTVIQGDVFLRGDLYRLSSSKADASSGGAATSISVGRCTIISTGCVLKPPCRMSRGVMNYYPMRIGDNVFIGELVYFCSSGRSRCLKCLPRLSKSPVSLPINYHLDSERTVDSLEKVHILKFHVLRFYRMCTSLSIAYCILSALSRIMLKFYLTPSFLQTWSFQVTRLWVASRQESSATSAKAGE